MKWLEWVFFDVRRYGRYVRIGWVLAGTAAILSAVVIAGACIGVAADRHYSQKSCEARAAAIGTEQFQWYDFTFFDYGCFEVSERGTTSDQYQRIYIED